MENQTLEKLRYPIGHFIAPTVFTATYLMEQIDSIASFPERLKSAVSNLT